MGGWELEAIALAVTLVVHVIGAGVLIWALVGDDDVDWRGFLHPEGGGGPGRRRTPGDGSGGGGSSLLLPDAEQSAERFREAGRLADRKPRPARRAPVEPAPVPAREREPA